MQYAFPYGGSETRFLICLSRSHPSRHTDMLGDMLGGRVLVDNSIGYVQVIWSQEAVALFETG